MLGVLCSVFGVSCFVLEVSADERQAVDHHHPVWRSGFQVSGFWFEFGFCCLMFGA
jgi:hypothetical protein